ncbi:MAG TPA: 30S ribosomal protein S7 [Phycisphaerae bacterium]|jgi:small subunit ribosomal protein S7|nr:30S ribosomal protein S7 [Phycisphaerae bacterium]HVX86145.1 30S ribosomal protein S7 [Phycisphaerae bacterium]
MGAKSYTSSVENLKPDPVYGNLLLSKFINCMMYSGKKATAQRCVYGALKIIEQRVKEAKPIDVFEQALNNVKPMIEVRSRRVGGANYQVPMAVGRKRQQSLAIRWVIEASRSKSGKPMHERLADELMAAARKEGAAMTTRENVHKMADANKAFAHFAW